MVGLNCERVLWRLASVPTCEHALHKEIADTMPLIIASGEHLISTERLHDLMKAYCLHCAIRFHYDTLATSIYRSNLIDI